VPSASGKDDQGPLRRAALPLVIALASQAAEPMITEWQQDPWLAVPVALGLAATSRAPQPAPGHLLWMAVDMLSMGLDDDDAFADLVDATAGDRSQRAATRITPPDDPSLSGSMTKPSPDQSTSQRQFRMDSPEVQSRGGTARRSGRC
jgi:hypothetical protein